ncbi:MAG: hypothetical protein R3C14_44385 [Caldilineaceae bacterium]
MTEVATDAQLWQEIRVLRAQVTALQQRAVARHRITLAPVQPRAFLGQPVTLMVQVTGEADDEPRVDLPLTLVTTWGVLRVADGYQVQEGESVTARTDVGGSILLTLLPPPAEGVWELQQGALETMLATLDGSAATPNAIAPGLQELVRHYRREVNVQFRQAVDRYFRDFYPEQFDQVTRRDQMLRWNYYNATVMAFAGEYTPAPPAAEEESSTATPAARLTAAVQGAAVLTLRFKDWLGPWLQSYVTLSSRERDLAGQLRLLKEISLEPQVLLDAAQGLVQAAANPVAGLVAEKVEQQAVANSLRQFLDKDLTDLPATTRLEVFAGLDKTASQIKAVGLRAQSNLAEGVDPTLRAKVDQVSVAQAALAGQVKVVEGVADSLRQDLAGKVGQSTFDALQKSLNELSRTSAGVGAKVDQVGAAQAALAGRVKTVEGVADGLRQDIAGKVDQKALDLLQKSLTELSRTSESVNADVSRLSATVKEMNGSVGQLQVDLRSVQEELRRRPGQAALDDLRANLDLVTRSLESLTGDLDSLRTNVTDELKNRVTLTDFTEFRDATNTSLRTKLNSSTLKRVTDDLTEQFNALRTTVTDVDSNFGKLKETFSTLDQNVRNIRVDLDKIRRP